MVPSGMPLALGNVSTFAKPPLNAPEDGTKKRRWNLILSEVGTQHHLPLWAIERETDWTHQLCRFLLGDAKVFWQALHAVDDILGMGTGYRDLRCMASSPGLHWEACNFLRNLQIVSKWGPSLDFYISFEWGFLKWGFEFCGWMTWDTGHAPRSWSRLVICVFDARMVIAMHA